MDGRVGCRRVGEVVIEAGEGGDAPIKCWVILCIVDKDFVEAFEEEEALLAHVNADQSWQMDIDTLVERGVGVATKSYEERLPLSIFLFWCVCACIFVGMCVRIWQFHVCRPMITSSIQNQILDMCFTRN